MKLFVVARRHVDQQKALLVLLAKGLHLVAHLTEVPPVVAVVPGVLELATVVEVASCQFELGLLCNVFRLRLLAWSRLLSTNATANVALKTSKAVTITVTSESSSPAHIFQAAKSIAGLFLSVIFAISLKFPPTSMATKKSNAQPMMRIADCAASSF